jgi:hypothetical protein
MQKNETKILNMFTYHCRFAMPTLKFCKKLLNMHMEQVLTIYELCFCTTTTHKKNTSLQRP